MPHYIWLVGSLSLLAGLVCVIVFFLGGRLIGGIGAVFFGLGGAFLVRRYVLGRRRERRQDRLTFQVGRADEQNRFTSLLGRYTAALGSLQNWGIAISPSSRLRAYEKGLDEAIRNPNPYVEAAFAHQMMFDLREIDEIIEIVGSFGASPSENELKRLRLLSAGTDLPDDDATARAREAQYELYLRAVLSKAGSAILGDPDLMVAIEGITFPIEAKRPGSLPRFDDRLREAVGQLEARGNKGVVAISLDQVLRPRGHFVKVPTREALPKATFSLLQEFADGQQGVIRKRVENRPVTALLLTARIPATVEAEGLLSLGSALHIEAFVMPGHGDYRVIAALRNALKQYLS